MTVQSDTKEDFIYLMGLFRNGTATRRDAERLWNILKGDDVVTGKPMNCPACKEEVEGKYDHLKEHTWTCQE